MLDQITPVILTYNEAPNIGRTLDALAWAAEVVVVDSGSTDETLSIIAQHANARILHRAFDNHAQQWNYARSATGVATEWILALDADYVVPAGVVEELRLLRPTSEVNAYLAGFIYCIQGRRLRGSAYPPVAVLYRKSRCEYLQDGHTQRLHAPGLMGKLRGRILHDDRKPITHWLASQDRYMRLEADKLLSSPSAHLSIADRLRLLIFIAPPLVLLHVLLIRGCILDGTAGLFYALQRTIAEMILSLHLLDRHLRGHKT
jgi:glycosyltransferase involved in cell wall biosynthesis